MDDELHQYKELPVQGCVTRVTYTPDGKYLASSDASKQIAVWLREENYEVWNILIITF